MMFDDKRAAELRKKVDGALDLNPIDGLSVAELRALRREIEQRLPKDDIGELDLEQELVGQYREVKALMSVVIDDMDTPANQKAQVANSVVSTLAQLVKMQEDLRREETFKLMESCLVEALKALPDETREAFYVEYDRLAKKAGLIE